MLLCGTANTLLVKWQDKQCVKNCDISTQMSTSDDKNAANEPLHFEQPVWQTFVMFIGELLCWIVFAIAGLVSRGKTEEAADTVEKEKLLTVDQQSESVEIESVGGVKQDLTGWSQLWLWIPAACDITATTLMNVGLTYVVASVYQMLRGGVVIFTGLFSVLFLRAKLPLHRVWGLVAVMLGVVAVGLTSILLRPAKSNKEPAVGVAMILVAQLFTACQFVVEEKIVMKYKVPTPKLVGLEGVFGILTIIVVMTVVYPTLGHGTDDILDIWVGAKQIVGSPILLWASLGSCISIGAFNFFGLTITGRISATSRSTIDTCRTLFVWAFSLALSWETFLWPQIVGFLVLLYGTFVFNDVIPALPAFVTRRLKK